MKNVLVLTMPNTRQYTIDTSGNNRVGTVFLLICPDRPKPIVISSNL